MFFFVHLLQVIFVTIYVLLRRLLPSKVVAFMDIFYIYFVLLLVLHWLVLNDECIISYIVKKLENKEYVIGTTYDGDLHDYLGFHLASMMIGLSFAMLCLTMTYLFYNLGMSYVISLIFVFAFISYILVLRFDVRNTIAFALFKVLILCLMLIVFASVSRKI
jgi:hypothetical protein